MPKVVEMTGKKSSVKSGCRSDIERGTSAEIVIFPGVRYERPSGDDLPDPALIRR